MPAKRTPVMWAIFHSPPGTRRRVGSSTDSHTRIEAEDERLVLKRVQRRDRAAPPRTPARGASRRARGSRAAPRPTAGARTGRARRSGSLRASGTSTGRGRTNAYTGERSPSTSSGAAMSRDQQVLRHVRGQQVRLPELVERRQQRHAHQRQPGEPAGLLHRRHRVAPPAEHPHRAQVQRRGEQQQVERGEVHLLERGLWPSGGVFSTAPPPLAHGEDQEPDRDQRHGEDRQQVHEPVARMGGDQGRLKGQGFRIGVE